MAEHDIGEGLLACSVWHDLRAQVEVVIVDARLRPLQLHEPCLRTLLGIALLLEALCVLHEHLVILVPRLLDLHHKVTLQLLLHEELQIRHHLVLVILIMHAHDVLRVRIVFNSVHHSAGHSETVRVGIHALVLLFIQVFSLDPLILQLFFVEFLEHLARLSILQIIVVAHHEIVLLVIERVECIHELLDVWLRLLVGFEFLLNPVPHVDHESGLLIKHAVDVDQSALDIIAVEQDLGQRWRPLQNVAYKRMLLVDHTCPEELRQPSDRRRGVLQQHIVFKVR